MFQETVGMLLEPERGVGMQALGTASRRVASCRMRTVISRSDLVSVQLGLVEKTNSAVTSDGQGCLQTRL